ncbi:MAG: hypothetical protein Sylvanvirus11_4 [Sylvanvirus sp.]|uniref:Uncharacterized protein n=1 Tax=Sylvanvirus sp. TaxID=2487774 RepID=A0A3G5AJT0_9VIRU|nr:MAG: hypothetical protein Sylvanvirus11_4 [Sylvanvirus sp.]
MDGNGTFYPVTRITEQSEIRTILQTLIEEDLISGESLKLNQHKSIYFSLKRSVPFRKDMIITERVMNGEVINNVVDYGPYGTDSIPLDMNIRQVKPEFVLSLEKLHPVDRIGHNEVIDYSKVQYTLLLKQDFDSDMSIKIKHTQWGGFIHALPYVADELENNAKRLFEHTLGTRIVMGYTS